MIPFLTYDNTEIQPYYSDTEYIYDIKKENSRNITKSNNIKDVSNAMFNENFSFLYEKTIKFDNSKKMNIIIHKFNSIIEIDKNFYKEENIELPNEIANRNLNLIIKRLLHKNVIPYKIVPSVEEGICIVFKNKLSKMYFEIYNDGDLGYIIEGNVKLNIEKNKDVSSIEEAIEYILKYREYEVS